MLLAYVAGREPARKLVDDTLEAVGAAGQLDILLSTLGRVVARVLKLKMTLDSVDGWINELVANLKAGDTEFFTPHEIPDSASGVAGWDAPRGCITDYNVIKGGRLENWQAVPASTWNFSPRGYWCLIRLFFRPIPPIPARRYASSGDWVTPSSPNRQPEAVG